MLKRLSIHIPKYDKGNYPCIIDTDPKFNYLIDYLSSEKKGVKKYIILDKRIKKFFPTLINKFRKDPLIQMIEVDANEGSKTLKEAEKIIKKILRQYPSKNEVIINLGGGVILNLGGFIAGLLLRGIGFVHIPTTISAQIDVFLGGKQAINHLGYKNQIGFYKDPVLCYINTNFQKSIPINEIKIQFLEGFKLCLTNNRKLFFELLKKIETLKQDDDLVMLDLIYKLVSLKKPLVKQDPFEQGKASGLIYGHTIGHAIEMSSKGKISHCEAVGFGMLLESMLAEKLKICDKKVVSHHKFLLKKVNLDVKTLKDINAKDILDHIKHDKKNYGGKIRFVFIKDIGKLAKNDNGYFFIVPEKIIKRTILKFFKRGFE